MSRIEVIKILKQLVKIQLSDQLNVKTYKQTIKDITPETYQEDLIAYLEADLLCFLFQSIPYYQIIFF